MLPLFSLTDEFTRARVDADGADIDPFDLWLLRRAGGHVGLWYRAQPEQTCSTVLLFVQHSLLRTPIAGGATLDLKSWRVQTPVAIATSPRTGDETVRLRNKCSKRGSLEGMVV